MADFYFFSGKLPICYLNQAVTAAHCLHCCFSSWPVITRYLWFNDVSTKQSNQSILSKHHPGSNCMCVFGAGCMTTDDASKHQSLQGLQEIIFPPKVLTQLVLCSSLNATLTAFLWAFWEQWPKRFINFPWKLGKWNWIKWNNWDYFWDYFHFSGNISYCDACSSGLFLLCLLENLFHWCKEKFDLFTLDFVINWCT